MNAFIDLTGQRFTRWVVEGLWEPGNRKYWRCRCDCGTVSRVLGDNLRAGKSKSCDCIRLEACTKHGMINHPAYVSWNAARKRCRNPGDTGFKEYGGRGITFCERWDDFSAFWKDMGPTWFKGATIDRIDNGGNYEPGNVRWATQKMQGNNRRDNVIVATPNGRMTIMQASEAFNIPHPTLLARVRAGWPQNHLFDPPAFRVRKGQKQ